VCHGLAGLHLCRVESFLAASMHQKGERQCFEVMPCTKLTRDVARLLGGWLQSGQRSASYHERMQSVPDWQSRLKRLWQPRNPLFWLMLVFNLLSSTMAWFLHLAQPVGALLLVVTLLALVNALAGMVLLWRLWADTAPPRA